MMARLVLVVTAATLVSVSGLAHAADVPASTSKASSEQRPATSFDIPDEANPNPKSFGSRIIAGTEIIPNAMMGIGFFGERAEKSAHAPSVARELSLPKSRKAAVGFSLRF
jgi:hypothetical protein